MGEEKQNTKYMGKYASCSCKRNCTICQTRSGLLFLLGRIYLPETQQGEESTTSCRLTGRLGGMQLCPARSPSHESVKSSSKRFLPDAGTPHSWQLLALCAGTGNARGWGWSDPAGHWHGWGWGLKPVVLLQLTSLRGWTCLFPAECCSVMEKWLFPVLAGNNERDLLALNNHHLLRRGGNCSVFSSPHRTLFCC